MRRVVPVVAALSVALCFALASAQGPDRPPMGQGPGGPGGPGGARPGMMFAPDSFAAERDSLIKLTLERIQGKENMPAESVFRNIKVSKGVPAGQLMRRMDAFGRTLGVSCRHCHIENHWADEDKPTKQIARDMMAMTMAINDSLLPKVHFYGSERRHVNCFTCHRGQPKPGGMERRGPGGPGAPGAPGVPGAPGAPGVPGNPGGDHH
jgi:hypothetical protein